MIRGVEDGACHFSFSRSSHPAPVTHCKADVSLTFKEKKFPTQLSLKHCNGCNINVRGRVAHL